MALIAVIMLHREAWSDQCNRAPCVTVIKLHRFVWSCSTERRVQVQQPPPATTSSERNWLQCRTRCSSRSLSTDCWYLDDNDPGNCEAPVHVRPRTTEKHEQRIIIYLQGAKQRSSNALFKSRLIRRYSCCSFSCWGDLFKKRKLRCFKLDGDEI